MTMISRIMGFLRDIILAQVFGAGPAFDAFVMAFKIPNFFRRLFAEGAFAQAFVPVLAEYRSQRPHKQVQIFISHIATLMSVVIIAVIAVVQIVAPGIVVIFAPGFWHDPVRYPLAVDMLRVTFPYLLLIALSALSAAILNTYHRFAIPAFSTVMLNIALISMAWGWAPHAAIPIYVLAWGVIIGGILQLVIQLPALVKLDLMPRPHLDWSDAGVRRVLKKMIPALFGVSVAQLSILLNNFFASFLPAGSLSWLYYSDRLTYLPLGVVAVALATVVMPTMANQHSAGAQSQYSATLDWALRLALIIGIPAALGLLVLAGPILATLIYHGAFTAADVIKTRESLVAYTLGLPAFMLIKLLAAAFYSRQNIALPVKIATIAVVFNLVLNIILMVPLAHAGLALATSLSAWLNALCLLGWLIRQRHYQPLSGWRSLVLRIIIANGVMAMFLMVIMAPLAQWLIWNTWERIWHLGFLIPVAIIIYLTMLVLSGMRLQHLKAPS